MSRARRQVLALALPVLAGIALRAQESGREPAFGLVRTATGTPWSHARVVLVGRVDEGRVGPVERLEVEADEGGRFRAAVLPGLRYAAWAFEILDGGARQRVSDAVGGIVPRRPVFLTGSRFPQWRRSVQLDVAEGVRRPLRVEIRSAAPVSWTQELSVSDDDVVSLPIVAPGPFELRVHDASGVRLVEHVERGWELATAREFDVEVPARVPTRVGVRDVATGKGVGGAVVCAIQDEELQPLGSVDADGCGTIDLPVRGEFVVLQDGYAPCPLNPGRFQLAPGGVAEPELREGFITERLARLGPGSRIAGRVVVGAGTAVVDAWLRTEEHGLFFHDERTRSVSRFTRSDRLGVAGRFTREPVLLEFGPEASLLLGADALAQLPEGWRAGLVPVVPSLFCVEKTRDGADQDLGEIDLLDALPVRLRVRSPGGVPLLGASVELRPLPPRLGMPVSGSVAPVDQRGEVLLLLPRDREFLLVVRHDGRIRDARLLWTAKGPRVAEPFSVEVRIERQLSMTGRVTDADGRPVDQGRVRWSFEVAASDPDSAPPARESGPAGCDAHLGNEVAAALARLIPASAVPLDEDGRFRFEVPGVRGVVAVSAGRDRVELLVAPDAVIEPILLRIER
jgi:hypothetical protein